MGQVIDLDEKFQEYFNELEGYSLRSMRFDEEYESGIMCKKRILEWLRAAYMQGCRDMAQDTLDTLGDYACAVSGCKPEVLRPEAIYDRAHDNLMVYYTQVLNKDEP